MRTRLKPLAIAYYPGVGGQGKCAFWQLCPTTEKSLKNALWTSVPKVAIVVPSNTMRISIAPAS
jgi:hypothetical protein